MSAKKLQVGQLWKKNDTGEVFLVTRVYSEALSTMVVLRRSGAEGEAQVKVRAQKNANGVTIPGYSPAQEDHF
ncbi:MAG TPA: hypothetical protein VJN42_05915 [Candidatus Acidoferrum sp.]|nr:hypothetical protein [Candidatus Acidoferrum sp.]